MHYDHDAIIVGSGPNGLAAAITLARAGCSVVVLEAEDTLGGGLRSAELTLPGFIHDVCSTVQSLEMASPFFQDIPLADLGVTFVHPQAPLAQPFDDEGGECAAVLDRSLDATAATLGEDGPAYVRLMEPLVSAWPKLADFVLGPLLRIPRYPFVAARFGLQAVLSADGIYRLYGMRGDRARGLLAGLMAHSMLPLERPGAAGFGLVLGASGHVVGWPVARGGSQTIADALAAYLSGLGGKIVTGQRVVSLAQLPPSRVVLCDVTPRQLLYMGAALLPAGYRRALARYRYGVGVFKLDWALDGPIPWRAAACRRAGTVHLGGTAEEIAASERDAWAGRHSARPYVILVQQTVFDPTRAPAGKHTAWGYCHVPLGSTVDMTEAIENQVERFAPGFRDLVLARSIKPPQWYEAHDANYVGGDINGGAQDLPQMFARPVLSPDPYRTPVKGLYICSSSTPPGGGVHGMCGYHAARSALGHDL